MEDLSLTPRHYQIIESAFLGLEGSLWSLNAPVFLFDRCWLRLDTIRFDELKNRLPPDITAEAPELIRYNHLLSEGMDTTLAMQECWLEFGMEEFYRAMRCYWRYQEKGNKGWTFIRYIETLANYRESFDSSSISIPLIVLGRTNTSEEHLIEWLINAQVEELLAVSHSSTQRK